MGALIGLGYAINEYLPWEYLTNLFIITREMLTLSDFMIDTNQVILFMGLSFIVAIGYAAFEASLILIKHFR